MDANLVTMARFAEIVGVNLRTIQRLSQENVLKAVEDPEDKRKRVLPLAESVQAYIEHRMKQSEGRARANRLAELEEQKLKAEVSLKQTESELKRMRHEINSGKYLTVEEVQLDYSRFFVILKKFLLAVPNRVSGMLAGHVDPVTARGIEKDIAKDITNMMNSFVVAGHRGSDAEKSAVETAKTAKKAKTEKTAKSAKKKKATGAKKGGGKK